jgi:hypothetical protein
MSVRTRHLMNDANFVE